MFKFIVLCMALFGLKAYGSGYEPLHREGVLTQPVKEIFTCLGAPVNTLQEANAYAQKHLLRTGERWDKQADDALQQKMKENNEFLVARLKALGMIDAVVPEKKECVYALLMGALRSRVADRLAHLKTLYDEGYRFKHVVLLGGVRELQVGEKVGLPADVTTEAEMMAYEYKQLACFENVQMLLVNAPMIQKPDGSSARPTTDSTLELFAKVAPSDGSCLVVSNNPYILRQTKTAQRMLDQARFPVTSAGPAASPDGNIVIFMDEFARTLYEESLQTK